MKIFGILFHVAMSGGLILRNPYGEGLLKYDKTVWFQTLTGKANLKTESALDCSKMCKVLSGYRMICRTWIYDAWTKECNLFKNTNPEFDEIPFDYDSAAEVFQKLDSTVQTRIRSPYAIRFMIGTDLDHRYRTIRNLQFHTPSTSYKHQAAKFLTTDASESEMLRFSIRVPAFHIATGQVPISGGMFESTAIWWINESECARVCDLTLGCKAWTYARDLQSLAKSAFEGCFLHETTGRSTTTAQCYTGYECSFGFKY